MLAFTGISKKPEQCSLTLKWKYFTLPGMFIIKVTKNFKFLHIEYFPFLLPQQNVIVTHNPLCHSLFSIKIVSNFKVNRFLKNWHFTFRSPWAGAGPLYKSTLIQKSALKEIKINVLLYFHIYFSWNVFP